MVSLVGQLAKLRLGSEEDLDDYFVRSQELMKRLKEAGEAITDTLFNALAINGLPDSYEYFLSQESSQPAKTFPELRTCLRNYDDSKKAQCGERTGYDLIAMQAARKKKGVQVVDAMCALRRFIWRRTANPQVTADNPVLEAVGSNEAIGPGAKKQECFKCGQHGLYARESEQGKTVFFSCCAATLMKGDDLIVDKGCTDYVERDKAVFSSFESWNEATTVEKQNGTLLKIEGKGSVEVEIMVCHDGARS